MPISINNNLSHAISHVVQHIENPNKPWGVLIEEIPSDIGRTYQSYKRGGFLEGMERFRRETLSAAVWLFGIPVFNWLGNKFFENVMHLPMGMDYADETIKDTVEYLKTGKNTKNLDTSEIESYLSKKIKDAPVEDLVKSVKRCKGISIIAATILNCVMMGVVIPKYNQYKTKKALEKQKTSNTALKNVSFDDFKNKTSKNELSFKGGVASFIKNIPYLIENNNTARLVSTDIPTLIGRAKTSRNKYEALENTIIDAGSIYFYNFCAHNLRDFICTKTKIPVINPLTYKLFVEADENIIKSALDKVKDAKSLSDVFNKDFADEIYDLSTFGKYSKINRHVRPEDIASIDNQVINYLKTMSSKLSDNKFDINQFRQLTKSYNLKSAGLLALGFVVAIYGLSTFLPKLAFKITTLLTGKNEFIGIANFDGENKNVTKI